MKSIFSAIFLILFFLQLSAQTPSTRLWRISGKGLSKPSYLFGSMHVDDERVFRFSDSLLYALESCEQFSNETHPDSLTRYLYKSIDDKFHERLLDLYTNDKDEDEAFNELSRNTGLDKTTLKKVSPVVLKQLIPLVTGAKKRRSNILDFYLYNLARHEGKNCIGIESVSSQIQVFNLMKDSLKYDYVEYNFGKKKVFRSNQLIDLYLSANLDELHKQMKLLPPDIYKMMISDRNIGMAAAIDSVSHNKSTFYTIGVGHLPGDEGVIKLLRDKGFRVEPVKETFTGAADRLVIRSKAIPWVNYTDDKTGYSIDFPSQWYTSPSFPTSLSHAMCFDLGTNSFYMVFSRPIFSINANPDSLLAAFIASGWKVKADKDKFRSVVKNGVRFSETDELNLQEYKTNIRVGIAGNSLILIMAAARDRDTCSDLSRFFDSFSITEKTKDTWNNFTSQSGGYQVLFPGNPNELFFDKTETGIGMTTAMINGTDNTTGQEFLVEYADYPDSFFDVDSTVFTAAIQGMISKGNYSLLLDSAISFAGFPARWSILALPNGVQHKCLLILRGSRFYMVFGTDNHTETDSMHLRRFFESFSFTAVDWSNWKKREVKNKFVNLVAPSEIVEEEEEYFNDKFDSYTRYKSNDKLTGEKIEGSRRVFSPYYRYTTSDSTFFWELFCNDHNYDHDKDSITKQLKLYQPATYAYEYELPGSHNLSRFYYCLKGRALYSFSVRIPEPYLNTYPWNQSVMPFEITDESKPGDLKEDMTQKLLADLFSEDTLIQASAKKALSFYTFSNAEMPLVWNTLFRSFPDEDANFESSRVRLIYAVEDQLDSLYAFQMKSAFDSVFPTPASIIEALSILADPSDFGSRDFIGKKLISIPLNSVSAYKVLSILRDSQEYAAGFYPQLLYFLPDTLNRSEVINTAVMLLDSNLVDKSALTPYRDKIFPIIKEYNSKYSQEETRDYYLSKVFLLSGYLNDPEINSYLRQNLGSNDSYASLYTIEALLNNDQPVRKKYLDKIAEDVEMRHEFYNYLANKGKTGLMPVEYRTQAAIAESDTYNYLISEELSPEELKTVGYKDFEYNGEVQRFFLVEFKDGYDESGGKTYTTSGPFPLNGSIPVMTGDATGGYWSVDSELSTEEHLEKAASELMHE